MDYDPFGFRQVRAEQERWRTTTAKEFIPGIDPADLKPGSRITISPNLRLGDRSYTDTIHTVLAVNSCHVQTMPDNSYNGKPVLLMAHEHHFYSAAEFVQPAAQAPQEA